MRVGIDATVTPDSIIVVMAFFCDFTQAFASAAVRSGRARAV